MPKIKVFFMSDGPSFFQKAVLENVLLTLFWTPKDPDPDYLSPFGLFPTHQKKTREKRVGSLFFHSPFFFTSNNLSASTWLLVVLSPWIFLSL
jgi:hypothetical protein